MPDFKNLNLNRDRIDQVIESFSADTKIISIEQKGVSTHYNIKSSGKDVLISFYFNQSGKTTINPSVGKNQDIGIGIATLVKEKALYCSSEVKNINYSIKNFDSDDFALLIKFLKESFTITGEDKSSEIFYTIKSDAKYNDTFHIHAYKNGNVHFQGKPLKIYSELYPLLCELVSEEEIFKFNEELYKVEIDKDKIDSELEHKLPIAHRYIGNTTKKILKGSITLSKVDIDLDDYTPFVFGSLRGMESFIKEIFYKKGITLKSSHSFVDVFTCVRDVYSLTSEYESKIGCEDTSRNLVACYSYYAINRHGLFHVDPIPEMSRLIEKREDAYQIIDKVFEKIERSCCEILHNHKS